MFAWESRSESIPGVEVGRMSSVGFLSQVCARVKSNIEQQRAV